MLVVLAASALPRVGGSHQSLGTQGHRWHCHPSGQCRCGSPSIPSKPGAGAAAARGTPDPTGCPTPRCAPQSPARFPVPLQTRIHPQAARRADPRDGRAPAAGIPGKGPERWRARRPRAVTFRNDLRCQAAVRRAGVAMAERQRGERSAVTGSGSPAAPPRPRRAPPASGLRGSAAATGGTRVRCHARGGEGPLGHRRSLCCPARPHPHPHPAQPGASLGCRADPSTSSGLLALLSLLGWDTGCQHTAWLGCRLGKHPHPHCHILLLPTLLPPIRCPSCLTGPFR